MFLSEETPVSGIPPSAGPSGEIRFIMTDELAEAEAEAEAESQPDGGEWVEVAPTENEPAEVEVTETIVEAQINGHTIVEDTVTITTTTEVRCSLLLGSLHSRR